jgi:hypothetical protein
MTNHDTHGPADLLDRAAAALREAPVADGPPPALAASMVEALQAASVPPDVVRLRERRRKMFCIARYSGAAAAAMLLAVLAGWLFLMDRTAPLAFGDVVQNVKNAKTVTFVTRMKSTPLPMLEQKWYIRGDAFRMEMPSAQFGDKVPADAPPVLVAVIADAKQKKALELDFARKTARKITADKEGWEDMAKGLANPIEQLRKLKSQDAKRIGEEELDGRKTQVYQLKKADVFMGVRTGQGDTAKLWVDPKTGLPVRIAVERPAGDGKEKEVLFAFEEFTWNERLDPALFKLEVPKGFTLQDK